MSKISFTNCKISGILSVIPTTKLSIDDELEYFDNNQKKLDRTKKMVGYGTRYITDNNTTTVDLCSYAGKQLFDSINILKDDIDCLIFITQTPDYIIPSSSHILHQRLELKEECSCFDISMGCSGYVYGLWLSYSLIQSGASKKILLLVGDTLSKLSYKNNRLINPIFGDAASATLIEYTPSSESYFILGSRGKGWDKICVPASSHGRIKIDEHNLKNDISDNSGNIWNLQHLIMGGEMFLTLP